MVVRGLSPSVGGFAGCFGDGGGGGFWCGLCADGLGGEIVERAVSGVRELLTGYLRG